MEKLRKEKEEQFNERNNLKRPPRYGAGEQQSRKTIKIGRPAYQVFKSRDTDTQQRCLTFELTYKDIKEDLRPRHRFMSAFEQQVDLPRDKRYQYVLFAAEPYETIAFKIPNEALDRDPGRLITHWDEDDKKFIVTLYFADNDKTSSEDNFKAGVDKSTLMETEGDGAIRAFAPALGSR
jgi:splicing factor 3A subunit 2